MEQEQLVYSLVRHIDKLLNSGSTPVLPPDLAEIEGFSKIHETLVDIRKILLEFSRGEVGSVITSRGFYSGCLKTLQANLRHLSWQVQQVSQGDFTQRVEFLGDFSTAFNSMVIQLHTTIQELKEKEEALTALTKSLKDEVELRKAAIIALRESESKFKYMAEHDPLTGCLNRRSFFSLACPALQNASLSGEPCCIALLDIDRFKRLNDTYGHLNGDTALKEVVKTASNSLRRGDIVGRFGGEEFIFFFSGINLEKGLMLANRIRKKIEAMPVPLNEGGELNLTVSIGVAVVLPEWPGTRDADFLQQIINSADQALYEAKNNGRNQVCAGKVIAPEPSREQDPSAEEDS